MRLRHPLSLVLKSELPLTGAGPTWCSTESYPASSSFPPRRSDHFGSSSRRCHIWPVHRHVAAREVARCDSPGIRCPRSDVARWGRRRVSLTCAFLLPVTPVTNSGGHRPTPPRPAGLWRRRAGRRGAPAAACRQARRCGARVAAVRWYGLKRGPGVPLFRGRFTGLRFKPCVAVVAGSVLMGSPYPGRPAGGRRAGHPQSGWRR
jgi:hypothetical protein